MKAIKVTTVITRVSALANNSAGISLHTPPLSEEELVAMLRLKDKDCDTLFAPIAQKDEEVITVDRDLQTKTQSQRIRNCLYILWEQSGKIGTFDDYYRDKTDMIIEWLKTKME